MINRRDFIKLTAAAGAGFMLPSVRSGRLAGLRRAVAAGLIPGLSDPAVQPMFQVYAPNALAPNFKFQPNAQGQYEVWIRENPNHETGLVNGSGTSLKTTIFGYADNGASTWPGRTFEVKSGKSQTMVSWYNRLGNSHLLPVDTNLHWAYSLHGESSANNHDYTQYSIAEDGVPIITHLHGGHTDFQYDGNPEFFYSPYHDVVGPQWDFVPGGFTNNFLYDNDVPAGTLWYHDHALGITRLNVYAGLAGFYFIRDQIDTGKPNNPLGLPAYPYELAYAIQDRMFYDDGELFYPAFPGDPFYADFIDGEGAVLPPDLFPDGGPTALAEFFGDHMVVNGKIWPKEDVEPRNYRMRLLNGTDSRFMVLQFVAVNADETDFTNASAPIPFWVIGSDQGLAESAIMTDTLVFEPGARYDIVFDFSDPALEGKRVIMKNIGGDEPFGGDVPGPQVFGFTDRVMAFDVVKRLNRTVRDRFNPRVIRGVGRNVVPADNVRRVALFEGKDEFGRLQPLLGTVADDLSSATAYTWFQPTTENPILGPNGRTTEEWEIYNFTGDAHPIHLHLVNFRVLGRNAIDFIEGDPVPVLQHNGEYGEVAAISDITVGNPVGLGPVDGYVENQPKDMVTALPGQMTEIRATFDKTGRYVWHCHILSHEDHEMMRVLQVDGRERPGRPAMQAVQGAESDAGSHRIEPGDGAQ